MIPPPPLNSTSVEAVAAVRRRWWCIPSPIALPSSTTALCCTLQYGVTTPYGYNGSFRYKITINYAGVSMCLLTTTISFFINNIVTALIPLNRSASRRFPFSTDSTSHSRHWSRIYVVEWYHRIDQCVQITSRIKTWSRTIRTR